MKHIFMLSNLFKSHLIRHPGTERAFKDTQRTIEHSEALRSTQRVLGHLGTRRTLRGHSGTRALKALGHLGTWTLRVLGHLGTWALRALRHLGTQGTRALGHLGTRGTLLSRLCLTQRFCKLSKKVTF